jgi:hypothetical protein
MPRAIDRPPAPWSMRCPVSQNRPRPLHRGARCDRVRPTRSLRDIHRKPPFPGRNRRYAHQRQQRARRKSPKVAARDRRHSMPRNSSTSAAVRSATKRRVVAEQDRQRNHGRDRRTARRRLAIVQRPSPHSADRRRIHEDLSDRLRSRGSRRICVAAAHRPSRASPTRAPPAGMSRRAGIERAVQRRPPTTFRVPP